MTSLERVVNRALSEESFCQALADDPEGTLRSEGVEPTPEMIAALQGLDAESIQKLAAAFGKEQAAAA